MLDVAVQRLRQRSLQTFHRSPERCGGRALALLHGQYGALAQMLGELNNLVPTAALLDFFI